MSRRFWSPLVAGLSPYVPGEQPQHQQLLKLNTNESPYPPSSAVLAALRSVTGDELSRYPDPQSRELCAAAARLHGVPPEQVFAGNGSDEILAHCFAALLSGRGRLQFPDITYSFYPVWAALYGVDFERVALREDFSIAPGDFSTAAGSVLIPNPNAPTGIALPLAAIREMLEEAPERLLVVDEAYVDFGAESVVPLIERYDNLLVVQTLSKSRALAGMRIGLAFGQKELIEALRRVKDSFNSYPIDCVAERVAVAALNDSAWFAETRAQVIASRERLRAGLLELGFEVLPSMANFVFARHPRCSGAELFAALRSRGILLRRWDSPRIEEFLRMTVGTDAQCEMLLAALAEELA